MPIPKSVSKARIVANGDLFGFKLADEDMKEVSHKTDLKESAPPLAGATFELI